MSQSCEKETGNLHLISDDSIVSLFLFINLFLINSEGRKKRKSQQIDSDDDDSDFVSEEPKEKRVKQSKANVS